MQRFSGPAVSAMLLLVFICTPVSVAIAQRGPEPTKSAPQLHVSTKSTIYRIGELIPLELAFSSATPKRYQINMASYDRASAQAQAEALRYLIHFVGDLHQPLHTTTNDDRGGNCVPVAFFDREPEKTNPLREDCAKRGDIILDFAGNELCRDNCLVYAAKVTDGLDGRSLGRLLRLHPRVI